MKSNPNPSFYPMLPYESLFSCTSIDKKIKAKKKKKKNDNQKLKEKKRKEKLNNDLAVLPSHDKLNLLMKSMKISSVNIGFNLKHIFKYKV